MINNIDEYLQQLKKELSGCDRATIQDALSDAEEHMRNALENLRGVQPDASEESVFPSIMEEYGTPSEIAEAYRKIDTHAPPAPVSKIQQASPSFVKRFFSPVTDIKAWGALLYLVLSLVTGIIFFTWAVTGVSLSLGLLILIIGIPFAGVFILSIRGLAFLEGRIVEALLGVRMPQRPLFSNKQPGLWARFKALISDKYTWSSLAYMILQLPLGIIYFTVFITLIAVSLVLVFQPVLELGFGLPLFTINGALYYLNIWPIPIAMLLGVIIFVLAMHLAKVTGAMHGRLAQAMLIKK